MNKPFRAAIRFMSMFLLCSIVVSCEFSSDINSDFPDKFDYPLKIGNTWKHERVFEHFNFRPDSIRNIFPVVKYVNNSIVEVIKDTTLQDSLPCVIVQQIFFDEEQELLSWGYYANKTDGLYEYGYKHAIGNIIMPKERNEINFIISGIHFRKIRDASDYFAKYLPVYKNQNDSLIYWEQHRKVLTYPPQIGDEWLFHQGIPFTIHKKILGTESVSTQAGDYDCYKIEWLYESNFSENITFYDYVCEKGLIKRSILFTDVVVRSPESPEGLGLVDTRDESVLTDINF